MSKELMQAQLTELEEAYYSGVLKVREGDDWVEYQSMKSMRLAIEQLEGKIARYGVANKPRGVRLMRVNKGFR